MSNITANHNDRDLSICISGITRREKLLPFLIPPNLTVLRQILHCHLGFKKKTQKKKHTIIVFLGKTNQYSAFLTGTKMNHENSHFYVQFAYFPPIGRNNQEMKSVFSTRYSANTLLFRIKVC